jgi:hypothetical protein
MTSVGNQKTRRDPLDRYYTPAWPTIALIDRWPWPAIARVLEPCAGQGHMAEVLCSRFDVTAFDVDPQSPYPTQDFLAYQAHDPETAIVTNPPYSTPTATAADFARHALTLTPYVAMLMRLSWLEACRDRAGLFRDTPPSEVWILPRVSFGGPNVTVKNNNGATAIWCIWGTDKAQQVKWIDRGDRA